MDVALEQDPGGDRRADHARAAARTRGRDVAVRASRLRGPGASAGEAAPAPADRGPDAHADAHSVGVRGRSRRWQLRHVQCRVIPKVHVFGHIHEGYGTSSDGTTVYVNASTCNLKYRPLNAPIVVDVRKPS